jgi:uncharacterized repeat protein (TIGR01451 family)
MLLRSKMLKLFIFCMAVLFALAIALPPSGDAQAAPPVNFTQELVANGLTNPTAMQFSPDGRLFVALEGGQLRVIKNGVLLPTPFLTVTTTTAGERGLLGIAFDPDFLTNGYVYVYYTVPTPVHNRISRFTAASTDLSNPLSDVAAAGSETVILELSDLVAANQNHNGGALNFGPDGMLYAAVGENQVGANAQSFDNMLGKILRINPVPGSVVPPDNPFLAQTTGNNGVIYAIGLRNPYTFAFQPGTGRLFVNDVGEAAWEEINEVLPGQNFGWPYFEADDQLIAPPPGFTYTSPRLAYDHGTFGFSCAVTGGVFYNNVSYQYPADYVGDYFYGDFCSGWISRYDTTTSTSQLFADNLGNFGLVDLKVSPDGVLHFLTRNGNAVYRFTYSGPPEILQHPASVTASEGATVTFTCAATGTAPIAYQWQRNSVDVPGATGLSYSLTATPADNGAAFHCVATNGAGSVGSNPAVLTVTAAGGPAQPVNNVGGPAIGVFDPGLSKIGLLPAGGIGLPGEQITWVTTVSNNGGAAGSNITVVDNVRPELRIDDVSTDRGAITVSGQRVTVTIPALAPGERIDFRIVTTVLSSPADGVIDNTVTIDGTAISARATVPLITALPSTGETPAWRDPLMSLMIAAGALILGGLALIGGLWLRRTLLPTYATNI